MLLPLIIAGVFNYAKRVLSMNLYHLNHNAAAASADYRCDCSRQSDVRCEIVATREGDGCK